VRGSTSSSRRLSSRLAGTSQATVSAFERSPKQPSISTLGRLLAPTGDRLPVQHDRDLVDADMRVTCQDARAS
jgi:hypothetical protein